MLVDGQDIHRVRYGERDRLAIHYHQSYQVRRFQAHPARVHAGAGAQRARRWCTSSTSRSSTPQDGYIGFMLDFFRRLRAEGRLVFLCLHPNEPYHLEILREACERFVFVERGRLTHGASLAELQQDERVRAYLGRLAIPPAP